MSEALEAIPTPTKPCCKGVAAPPESPPPGEQRGEETPPTSPLERFDDPAFQQQFVRRASDGHCAVTLSVSGMRCAGCAWRLEAGVNALPGVSEAQFGVAQARAQVRWNPSRLRLSEILSQIEALGCRAQPFVPDGHEQLLRDERRSALRRLGVSGLGTMQVMMFSIGLYTGAFGELEPAYRDLLRLASALVATPVLAYAGLPFFRSAWRDLRDRRVGAELPIALALTVAYGASVLSLFTGRGEVYFDSVCMFVFFLTLARTIEGQLRARSELRIHGLSARLPEQVHQWVDGRCRDVPLTALQSGDVIELRAGEVVPADGIVVSGRGEVDEAILSGEPTPVRKQPGDAVFAGSANLDAPVRLRVERVGADSTVSQIATLLDRAQLSKPPVAVLADRVARAFLTGVLLAAGAVAAYWAWFDAPRAVPIVVSVLVATCPCALSLATPAALAAATHALAERGLLIKKGHVLESLAQVGRVVFDKTGTLTEATPVLSRVDSLQPGVDPATATLLATALEQTSRHPIARALRAELPASSTLPPVDALELIPGRGAAGQIGGRRFRFGRPDWSRALAAAPAIAADGLDSPRAGTTALLSDDKTPLAAFYFETRPRPEARDAVGWLERRGYATALLSGDPARQEVATLATRLGIQEAHAGTSPEEKLRIADRWVSGGDVVLAVGDGVNDAPLLGRAQVSLAMGSGSDLAHLEADAVLLEDRLATIPLALEWAHRTRRVMRQNFAWALGYNACALPLAAMGLLPPYLAAIGMSLSSLLVVANSLRLRHPPPGAGGATS
ncbi:MAG: cation-translocating P-type ATPase [Proteobacteria bacterium]|nr:cation-translocating P-type ATPase [Pseudomonadota bacterium]